MGVLLFNGLWKDFGGQGIVNYYNGDLGFNGDDCSVELCNFLESIVI